MIRNISLNDLDKEKKELEPQASTLTSAKFFEENIGNVDKSENKLEQPLNQSTSEINLPARKQNVESAPSSGVWTTS